MYPRSIDNFQAVYWPNKERMEFPANSNVDLK